MPSLAGTISPCLATFLSSLKSSPIETSIEHLVSYAHLLRRVLRTVLVTDVAKLIESVRQVGQRLVAAQPKELAVGNIVRRILGLIRDEAEEDRDGEAGAQGHAGTGSSNTRPRIHPYDKAHPADKRPSVLGPSTPSAVGTNAPALTSAFSLLPSKGASPLPTPGTQSPVAGSVLSTPNTAQDFIAEVVEGVQEIIDELDQVDDQIAGYALDHIHSSDFVLTYTPSMTVQRFLLKAAAKRKFTVIHAKPFAKDNWAGKVSGKPDAGHDDDGQDSERFLKALTAAGVMVLLIPFSAVFALMPRVSKVVLDTHMILADGSLVASVGARLIAKAASMHRTPVIVLSGVYKLSPVYPSDVRTFMDFGDPSSIIGYDQGSLIEQTEVKNPMFDYLPADLIALYITNL
ncbi:MAG: hypothetical protein Q9213_003843 [Squamulea squamosa]